MGRKASVHVRRKSSAVKASGVGSLAQVAENESEAEKATLLAKAAQELIEMEALEAEREARFQEAERELMGVLETDEVSESVRKRQLTRLFDRFRFEYSQLSLRFRENMRLQHKLMEKCLEMKNELVMSAIRIKTAKQLQEEEMKNLVFYREECEHAWKATNVCEERERDAMRIIDELKAEIDDLQGQVKALLGMDTSSKRGVSAQKAGGETTMSPSTSQSEAPSPLSPVRSPVKKFLPEMTSPTKGKSIGSVSTPTDEPHLMSFDEWKLSTRVWSPSVALGIHKAPTPSQDELLGQERAHEMARCVSVPTLQPTAMERAATAVANASPSRRDHFHKAELDQRRATTSINSKRTSATTVHQLPSVSTRKPPPL